MMIPSANKAGQPWHPVVQRLLQLLESDQQLSEELRYAVSKTGQFPEPSFDHYCELIHKIQTMVPDPNNWLPLNLKFYFVLSCAKDDYLSSNHAFMTWVNDYVHSIGQWMNDPGSVSNLQSFIKNPEYEIEDFVEPPGGWLNFNQFFARQVRPGARPVANIDDDEVVVSAADSRFCGTFQIHDDTTVTAKGLNWNINDLLDGSKYADQFTNGIYGHSFLAPTNYHRFHTPVRGKLLEMRTILGSVTMVVDRTNDGGLGVSKNEIGYQFTQERGLAVIDSPIGLVAVIPIGMGIVSSVTFSAKSGSTLEKGNELGFFSFGGSDVILLFQEKAMIDWNITVDEFRRQGTMIARAKRK
jgi:phosphatidylserine decarboxylase precursor